jgi:hypothetical protein
MLLLGVVVRIVEAPTRRHIMPIKLRVVGILYNTDVDLSGDSSVQQVLDAAVASPGPAAAFGYTSAPAPSGSVGTLSISAFYAQYANPVVSVTSGNTYPAGEYYLEESASGQYPHSIWQYYIFDENGDVVGPNNTRPSDPTNPGGGMIVYYDNASAIVPAGGSLVWRLVAIPTAPNAPSPIALSRLTLTSKPA